MPRTKMEKLLMDPEKFFEKAKKEKKSKKEKVPKEPGESVGVNPYTVFLGLTVLALIIGSVFLWLEWSRYPSMKANVMNVRPAVSQMPG